MTWVDLFLIWSDGKTLKECAKEHGMTKVGVFIVFVDHLVRLGKELERGEEYATKSNNI